MKRLDYNIYYGNFIQIHNIIIIIYILISLKTLVVIDICGKIMS